jgi:hypothetical protein
MKTDKEIIRSALFLAISDRKSYLDSWSKVTDEEGVKTKARIIQEIQQYQELLIRRYGGIPKEPEFTLVSLTDLMRKIDASEES